MHDIRAIRTDPSVFDHALARRGIEPQAQMLLELDDRRRETIAEAQQAQGKRNELSREIGKAKARADQDTALRLMAEVAILKESLPSMEASEQQATVELEAALAELPNIPAYDVPDGADEHANVMIHERGDHPVFGFTPREHDAIGPALGLDFETGAAMAGARFTLLRGPAARLHRALGQFMLDRLRNDYGCEEVSPPLLVRDAALFGTGQLPKFAEDLFRTTDDRWMIPTAEVPLTNIVRETILAEHELPLRFAALTPCFRSEAGAAGRDTRGLIRQHQFDKVEMVSITTPDQSGAEHERMTACAEAMLDALGLPYRRMLLCVGDMGFTAMRTYDLEVWLPGQDRYREISSCSACGDFQSRRMNARYRPAEGKGTVFVHTLNGSALAVGRTLVGVIENHQRDDGSVVVPEVLRPYLGGDEILGPRG